MSLKPVSNKSAIVLIILAAFFDALSLVPGLNEVSAVLGQIVLATGFFVSGVNVFRKKAGILYALTTFLELVPASSALPMFLIETIAIIALSRLKSRSKGY